MYAVEFQAPIVNGILHIPSEYSELYDAKQAQIFIIPLDAKNSKSFDPKRFFGAGNSSKEEIDEYLQKTKNDWLDVDSK